MSGLRQDVKKHFKWLIVLTAIVCGIFLRGCYTEKKENYTDLHKRVAEHEARILKLEGR